MEQEPVMPYCKPPKPRGYPRWFVQSDKETENELAPIGQLNQDAMIAAGTYPTGEYLDSLHEEERRKVLGNARAIIEEFVEHTFYRPIGQWLRSHPYNMHTIISEQDGPSRGSSDAGLNDASHPHGTGE